MNNLAALTRGELIRMKKYNILAAGIFVALIWILVLHLTEAAEVGMMLVVVLYFDVMAMAGIMIGVTVYYEKQESTLKTMLVAPISKEEFILAKVFANMSSSLMTMVILLAYAYLVRDASVNILILLGAVILGVIQFSMIGYWLTYRSRDFTGMLINLLLFNIFLGIPVILDFVGLIQNETFSKALYALPTKALLTLMTAAVNGPETWEVIASIIYLIVLSLVVFQVIRAGFDRFAAKESGS